MYISTISVPFISSTSRRQYSLFQIPFQGFPIDCSFNTSNVISTGGIQDSNDYDMSFQKEKIKLFQKIKPSKNILKKIIPFRNFSNSINYRLWNPGIMLEWMKHFWNNLRFFSNVICKRSVCKMSWWNLKNLRGIWKIPLSQKSTVFTQCGEDTVYKKEMLSNLWKITCSYVLAISNPWAWMHKNPIKNAGKKENLGQKHKNRQNCEEKEICRDPGCYNVCGTQTSSALTALLHESQ